MARKNVSIDGMAGVGAVAIALILPLLAACASSPPESASESAPLTSPNRPELENFTQRIEGTAIELEMIAVPSMIDPVDDRHVGGFYISKTELPWELYDLFVYPEMDGANEKAGETDGVDALARPSKPYVPPDRGFGHAGYPANSMTHHAATEFCKWLSARTGRTYRLPARAEWIYAAGGRSDFTDFKVDEEAWHDENSDWKTHPIATKEPNNFGLHDTLGNTAEWIADDQDGDGLLEIVGGHYLTPPEEISRDWIEEQTSAWNASDPQIPKSKWWLPDAPFVGFRVVCEGEEKDSPQRHREDTEDH